MDITFKKLTASDIDSCLYILHANYPKENESFWAGVLRSDIWNSLNKVNVSDFILVLNHGLIIGFGCYMYLSNLKLYRLSWINIFPDDQNKGIGKLLVQHMELEIRKQLKKENIVSLETDKPYFYKKLGYVTTAKYDGNDIMRKTLFPL